MQERHNSQYADLKGNVCNEDKTSSPADEMRLPSFQEFLELIEGDAPLRASSCDRNYAVYHKYSDGAAW